jgi:hypothetical protein
MLLLLLEKEGSSHHRNRLFLLLLPAAAAADAVTPTIMHIIIQMGDHYVVQRFRIPISRFRFNVNAASPSLQW